MLIAYLFTCVCGIQGNHLKKIWISSEQIHEAKNVSRTLIYYWKIYCCVPFRRHYYHIYHLSTYTKMQQYTKCIVNSKLFNINSFKKSILSVEMDAYIWTLIFPVTCLDIVTTSIVNSHWKTLSHCSL